MKIRINDRFVVFHTARFGLRKWLKPALKHPNTLVICHIAYLKYLGCNLYVLHIEFSAQNDFGAPCRDYLTLYADRHRIYRHKKVQGYTGIIHGILSACDLDRLNASI